MPKFLLGNITVRTFEVWADDKEQAEQHVLKWQEDEAEEPEGGIKATSYKLGWQESSEENIAAVRDLVLAEMLRLMHIIPPGIQTALENTKPKKGLIIHPFAKDK